LSSWLLTFLLLLPLAGVLALLTPPYGSKRSVRNVALACSILTAIAGGVAVYRFHEVTRRAAQELDEGQRAIDEATRGYVLVHHLPWLEGGATFQVERAGQWVGVPTVDIGYRVGVDGISIWLIALTCLLMPLAIWSSFTSIQERVREYYCLLLLLQAGLLGVFCALDLLLFYVFFEFTLIPLFLLIGIWGGPERRRAAAKFFLFTLAGSVITFAGIVYLAYYSYTTLDRVTLFIPELIEMGRAGLLPVNLQWWLFLAFAAGFAIKVPLFPLHTWLPLAHTEAPTAGSVILAGVLLKLGTYGFCRLSIPMLPDASMVWGPFIAVLAIIGIIYAALAAWVQTDIKKLVAYSSVSHLGFCMLGLFSLKIAGVSGGVLYMINHGLSTGALFLLVGYIYERYHTRDMNKIGGLARRMPWFAFFLVFFTFSSVGLPGLNGFVGEFLVLLGAANSNTVFDGRAAGPLHFGYVIPAASGIVLGAVYMLWMCQRVLFGPLVEPAHELEGHGLPTDLSRREIGILVPLALACLVIGVYPKPLLQSFESAARAHVLLEPASTTMTKSRHEGTQAPATASKLRNEGKARFEVESIETGGSQLAKGDTQ
jgi:NADH-quinone oxidoreductase subunit M